MRWVEVDRVGCFWIEGPLESLEVHETTAVSTGTFINTAVGRVVFEAHAFVGPWVMLLTGSHDYTKFGHERMHSPPYTGRNCDIILRAGAWVCGGAIVIGPCDIGEHAVISAGAVVTGNVPAYAIVHGNPGHVLQDLRERSTNPLPCPTCHLPA